MASFVKAADVLVAAVEIERRGKEFYEKEAKKAESKEVKEFFSFLAGEEVKHEKIFEAMLKRSGGLELPASSSSKEYMNYVSAALDSHLLFTKDKQPDAKTDPYLLALRFEKDTIIYFMALIDLVPESEKTLVQHCIEEEKRHIALIYTKKILV
jgi:rubrerythrin